MPPSLVKAATQPVFSRPNVKLLRARKLSLKARVLGKSLCMDAMAGFGTVTRKGMPPILYPPGKKSVRIEQAVDKITRDRLGVAPLPPRG